MFISIGESNTNENESEIIENEWQLINNNILLNQILKIKDKDVKESFKIKEKDEQGNTILNKKGDKLTPEGDILNKDNVVIQTAAQRLDLTPEQILKIMNEEICLLIKEKEQLTKIKDLGLGFLSYSDNSIKGKTEKLNKAEITLLKTKMINKINEIKQFIIDSIQIISIMPDKQIENNILTENLINLCNNTLDITTIEDENLLKINNAIKMKKNELLISQVVEVFFKDTDEAIKIKSFCFSMDKEWKNKLEQFINK